MSIQIEEERLKALEIAKAIHELRHSKGFQHFKKAVEHLIDAEMPQTTQFDQAEAVKIAAQMAHLNGMKRAIGLVEQQARVIKELENPGFIELLRRRVDAAANKLKKQA